MIVCSMPAANRRYYGNADTVCDWPLPPWAAKKLRDTYVFARRVIGHSPLDARIYAVGILILTGVIRQLPEITYRGPQVAR